MEYVRGFGKSLGETLLRDLGVTGLDAKKSCSRYTAEARDVVAKRESFIAKLKRFKEAQRTIEDWQAGC